METRRECHIKLRTTLVRNEVVYTYGGFTPTILWDFYILNLIHVTELNECSKYSRIAMRQIDNNSSRIDS
ncbi:MAG: hypothetical protein ACI93R_002591 [Flavobacteriales bacterium]|jgi:hypothetical protein